MKLQIASTEKQKVAVFVSPAFSGHVNPLLSLAHLFRNNGYRVHFFCSEDYRSKIEGVGATFHCDGPTYKGDVVAAGNRVAATKFDYKEKLAPFQLIETILPAAVGFMEDGFVREVRALAPSVIVSDMFGVWGTWTASILEVPAITSFSGAFMDVEEQFGYARDIELTKKVGRWLEMTYNISVDDPVTSMFDPGNFMISWGFPQLQPMFRPEASEVHWFGASLPKDIDTLIEDASEKDQAAEHGSLVRWIEEEKVKGKKVIYCSMGTVAPIFLNTITSFFPKVVEAFGNSENYSCVLSIGRDQKPQDLGASIPDNFAVYPSVNQNLVLSKVDAFITHGGNNSVNESCFMGCPMLCIPLFGDQFQNGAMIERANCGDHVASPFAPQFLENFDHVSPSLLVEKLDKIMVTNRDKITSSCALMQKQIRSLHGYYHGGGAFADMEAFITK